MSAPTIQPGTRCACNDRTCCFLGGKLGCATNPREPGKPGDAVRMVTVREACDYCAAPITPDGKRGWETGDCDGCDQGITEVEYEMCAPCAAFHEAKAGQP